MAPTAERRAHADVGRPVRRRAGRADGGLHAIDRDRRRAGARRHRGVDRPRARPRPGGPPVRRRGRRPRGRARGAAAGRRGGRGRLGPDARGRAPQPRDAAHRESGTGRRQAPHRPVAQRPGRHGPAAVVPPRGGPPRRRDRRPRARAGRAGGARRRRGAARLHAHPAGPARAVRPPPARLRRDARARPRAARGRARPPERLAAGRGGPRRRRLPARPRDHGRGARLRRRLGQLARRRLATATSSSSCWPRPPWRWCTSAAWRRRSPGGRTRGSGSSGSPTPSRPARR